MTHDTNNFYRGVASYLYYFTSRRLLTNYLCFQYIIKYLDYITTHNLNYYMQNKVLSRLCLSARDKLKSYHINFYAVFTDNDKKILESGGKGRKK